MYYEVFQKLCEERNVKPGTVSRATGVPTSTLTAWKQGKYTPKNDKLQKIADYFGVPLDYITGERKEGRQNIIRISDNLMSTKKPRKTLEELTVGDNAYYYLSREAAEVAQFYLEHPEFRILFDASKDSDPESMTLAAEMLKRMKRTNPDG